MKNNKNKDLSGYLIITTTLIIVFSTFLGSCGAYKGYAVVLWAEEGSPFKNGDIANISKVYEEDRKYIAIYEKDFIELPAWRVMFFESFDQAKEYAEKYGQFINTFAVCKKNDLPVREEPVTNANRVTKLKSGQIIKIVEKDKQEKIGNMNDFWYRILTDKGHLGFVYGYYLNISESLNNFQKESPTLLNPESLVEALGDNTWVPLSTEEMVKSGILDLSILKKNYGLVLKQEEKKVILVLEDFNKEYQYTDIQKTESGKLTFEGTDLQVEISPSSNQIIVYYLKNTKKLKKELVMLDKDLNQIIWQEQKRRNDLLNDMLKNGDLLASSLGGKIHLSANWQFTWDDFEKLSPQIIPENASGKGRIDFTYYLSFGLRTRYDGAITFYFEGNPAFTRTFLYTLAGNGIKLIYVPEQDIENLMIMRASQVGTAMDFSFSGE
jgi:hypothetical protein